MTSKRMSRRFLQAVVAAALLAIGLPARAESGPGLTGSWLGRIVPTSVPIPPTTDLITFMRDGTVIESQRPYLADTPWGPLLRTSAHGEWERIGNRDFAVTVMLIYQGAPDHPTTPGEVLAIEKARMKLTLDQHGNHFSGTLLDEIRDVSGNVIFLGVGTYEATRIAVEPLP
jgi:hypothetical protein